MVKKSFMWITIVYFILLTMVFPYYMRDGYYDIGQAKYDFFKYASFIYLIVLGSLIIWGVLYTKKHRGKSLLNKEDVCDERSITAVFSSSTLYLFAYGIICILSFIMSSYKETALFGVHSWNMGLITQLLLILIFLVMSRISFPKYDGISLPIWFGIFGSVGVFVLGILNRYSYFMFNAKDRDATFISTLGNVNWFCGYWLIFASLGMGAFLVAKQVKVTIVLGLYSYLAILTGILQGSSSAALVFISWIILFIWFAFEEKTYLERFLQLGILGGLAILTIRRLYLFSIAGMQFDSSLIKELERHPEHGIKITIFFLLAEVIVHFFIPEYQGRRVKEIRAYIFAVLIGLVTAVLLVFVINSMVPGGIWPVRDISVFYFSDLWGNGRGGIWKNTIMAVGNMNFKQILFGVGPDCYGVFLRDQANLQQRLMEQFGQALVSSAHNEWLTELVNVGVLGLFFYLAGFVACIKTCVKKCSVEKVCIPLLLCIFAYMANQTVGFRQILSAPFIFMVLGLSEGLTKRSD